MGNGQSSNQPASSRPRADKRPLHPPRKKSIELPDINKLTLSAINGSPRHSRVSSLTPLSPARRTTPITSPAPIPIPVNNINPGMLDIEQQLTSSPSPGYLHPAHAPSTNQTHPTKPPNQPTIAIPVSRPSQPSSRVSPSPSGRASPPRMRAAQPPRVPDAFIYSSIPLGIVLPATGINQTSAAADENDGFVSTTIYWRGGGTNVFLAGTFESSWRGRIRMNPE